MVEIDLSLVFWLKIDLSLIFAKRTYLPKGHQICQKDTEHLTLNVADWGESRNCRTFPGRPLSISCFRCSKCVL